MDWDDLRVFLAVARGESLSAAGRKLFAASRELRRSTNDADRLRKNPLGVFVNAINWSKELAQ